MCKQTKTEDYFLRLKFYSDWPFVLNDPVLGPIVESNYELVKKYFLVVKKINEINNQMNENLNETLFELGVEPLNLNDDDAVNQQISDIISDDITKSINKSIQKSIRKKMEEDFYD